IWTEDPTQRGESLSGKSRTPHESYSHGAFQGDWRAAGNCGPAFNGARLRRARAARRRARPSENSHRENAGENLRARLSAYSVHRRSDALSLIHISEPT